MSVEEDAPTIRVVEAGEKPCNRALSRSGCTDERERLAGSDFQVETIEDRCIALVSEADCFESHGAADRRRELGGMARLTQLRFGLEDLADPRARADGLL